MCLFSPDRGGWLRSITLFHWKREHHLLGVCFKWNYPYLEFVLNGYPQLHMSNDNVQGPWPTSMLEALEIVEHCSCGAIGDVYIIFLAEMH